MNVPKLTEADIQFFPGIELSAKEIKAFTSQYGEPHVIGILHFTLNTFNDLASPPEGKRKSIRMPFTVLNLFTTREKFRSGRQAPEYWCFGAYLPSTNKLYWFYEGHAIVFERKEAVKTYNILAEILRAHYSEEYIPFAYKELARQDSDL